MKNDLSSEDRYEEIFDKHVRSLRNYSLKKKDLPNVLAEDLEKAGMSLPKISSEIKRRLREYYDECEISESWIEKNLEDKYKRPKKDLSITRQNTVSSSETNEEKKEIMATVGGSQVSEPAATKQPTEPPSSSPSQQPQPEPELKHKAIRITMSPGKLVELSNTMKKMIQENGFKTNYAIEYDYVDKDLYVDVTEEWEKDLMVNDRSEN